MIRGNHRFCASANMSYASKLLNASVCAIFNEKPVNILVN